MSHRCLFIVRELPRPAVSVASMIRGEEALSGTHASGLLVAEGLARRGHAIGVCVLGGQEITASAFASFATLEAAAEWVRAGRVIWLSYGDESILEGLKAAGLKPLIWTHLPVTRSERRWLENGEITGLVTVSDTCRIPLLRSTKHSRVGRVYNPLAPLFAESTARSAADRSPCVTVVVASIPR